MSMAQKTMGVSPSGDPHCPTCKAVLPPHAAFCASCGERIVKKNAAPLFLKETDISARYRITSLIRRHPFVSLFFAFDSQQERPVAIREINIKDLNDEARATACEVVQHEYDLLRREHVASIMPVIDLQYFQGYIYVVAGWQASTSRKGPVTQFQTLQDLLQSGIGLPDIQVALSWAEQICLSLDHLHRHSIILGELDPRVLILDGNSYKSELALMVSWLPPAIRDMLSPIPVTNNSKNFSAPEALFGKPEPCSDIYSLGAVLYLLLTGTAPEEPALRMQRRSRPLSQINPRINSGLDEFVMKALSLESSERFQSAAEMSEAILRLRLAQNERKIEEIVNTDTIQVTPAEKSFTTRQALKASESDLVPAAEEVPAAVEGELQHKAEGETPKQVDEMQTSRQLPASINNEVSSKNSFVQDFKKRVTGILPAIRLSASANQPSRQVTSTSTRVPTNAKASPVTYEPPVEEALDKDKSLLKQLQRLIRGEQKHGTMAAAIIETPLRVQPNQSYTIRIQLMGRNEAGFLQDTPLQTDLKKSIQPVGLSALVEGELVYIEVRSALYQSYAYIVQRAAVYIPAQGYAAEVTIPMQPLSNGPNGRRERLHIFFMDEMRRPLYEKPFVIELFISHLVQPGREGHNVLTIPL